MGVVVLDVLARHGREVARSGDQELVEAFAAQRANPALGDRVRSRRANRGADDAMSVPANTASKAAVNLLSRSRIRNRSPRVSRFLLIMFRRRPRLRERRGFLAGWPAQDMG